MTSSSSSSTMERGSGSQQDGHTLVRTLACVLQKLIDVNRKLDTTGTQVITKFHASRPPSITVRDYLERINKYASCSTECFVLALVYIDRLIQHSNFSLTSLNVHRVIITSVMLAAKFFDDQYFNNLYYAKVGGVPCKEINALEVEFLFLVNFSLHVTEDQYYRYYTELANHAISSACPCCAGGSIISKGLSSPVRAEPAMIVVTTPPAQVVPFQQPQPPQPQRQQQHAGMALTAMESHDPHPPPSYDYYVPQNVMMAPTTITMKSSSLPTSTNGPLFVTGSFPATRHGGGTVGVNPALSSMAEVVAGEWDRAPGRHQVAYGGAAGGMMKFPIEQAVLVGVGGGYEYTNTYEYDYPPIVMPGPLPTHHNQPSHHHHHHGAKMTAPGTSSSMHTGGAGAPSVMYSTQPYAVMGVQIPLNTY